MAIANQIFLFLFLLSSHSLLATPQLQPYPNNSIDFIKQSCNTTLYPTLCFQCLSPYANSIQPPYQDKQLAQTSLQISLKRARSAAKYISKLPGFRGTTSSRDHQVVKDCFDTLGDSVYELNNSIKEMDVVSENPVAANPNFSWHMNNVRTWVSAALTDDNTCLDGFSESSSSIDRNVRNQIKVKVNDVAQVTSIALAFVTHFADGATTTSP